MATAKGKRSVAAHAADTRRNVKDHTDEWIRAYIGRHLIRVLVADQELANRRGAPLLTPQLRTALRLLEPLAITEELNDEV